MGSIGNPHARCVLNGITLYFVKSFIDLYGREFVSHCVHLMIHVKADVEKFGAVDNFSAFRFKNFYRTLTRLVRKGDKPLQQIAKRYLELEKKTLVSLVISSLNQNRTKLAVFTATESY